MLNITSIHCLLCL